jgi:hypothetical protein
MFSQCPASRLPWQSRARLKDTDINQFLTYVVEGNRIKAAEMLRNNPDLAWASGDIIDPSGKHFFNITAFQYAVWALDWDMWKMIRRSLTNEEARQQLIEAKRGSWTWYYGHHADWSDLIDALESCSNCYGGCREERDPDKHVDFERANSIWVIKVREAQLGLPKHVVAEYCARNRSFQERPDFTQEMTSPRLDEVYTRNGNGEWFSVLRDNNNLAIYRGQSERGYGLCTATSSFSTARAGRVLPTMDRIAMEELLHVRKGQYKVLMTELRVTEGISSRTRVG